MLAGPGGLLGLQWRYATVSQQHITEQPPLWHIPDHDYVRELASYAKIGYAKGFHTTLEKIDREDVLDTRLVQHLYRLVKQVRFDKVIDILERP